MNGRNHCLAGAALFVGVVAPLSGPWTPTETALGLLVAAGAGLLPDVDHPESTIAHTLGPVTRHAAHLVERVTGGHRGATHSLVFLLATTQAVILATALWPSPTAAIAVGLAVTWCVQTLGWHHNLLWRALALIAGTLVAWGTYGTLPTGPWLPLAVATGIISHLAADLLGHEGIRLFWPLPNRICLGVLRNGHGLEPHLAGPLLVVIAWRAGAIL